MKGFFTLRVGQGRTAFGPLRVPILLAALAALVVALTPAGNATAADAPRPTNSFVSQSPLSVVPGQYEIVHFLFEFAPGAATAEHKHGGPGSATVLEGQITVRIGDAETVYSAGQTIREPADTWVTATNKGAVKAKAYVSYLLSPGATLSMNNPNKPLPATLPVVSNLSRTLLGGQPAEMTLTQVVTDWAPGTEIPLHIHGGPGLVTVTQGEMVFGTAAGEVTRSVGGTFIDVDVPHTGRNAGAVPAQTIFTVLLRPGKPITTILGATAPALRPV